MCFFCVYVLSQSRHISSQRRSFTFRSISISITGARELRNKHGSKINQTGASDQETEREGGRQVQTRLEFVLFSL